MSYYDGGDSQVRLERSAKPVTVSASHRSAEGKAAKKVFDAINQMSFSAPVFVYIFVGMAGTALEERIMEIVRGIIRHYAGRYDSGQMNDATRDAKRLHDTMQTFKMP